MKRATLALALAHALALAAPVALADEHAPAPACAEWQLLLVSPTPVELVVSSAANNWTLTRAGETLLAWEAPRVTFRLESDGELQNDQSTPFTLGPDRPCATLRPDGAPEFNVSYANATLYVGNPGCNEPLVVAGQPAVQCVAMPGNDTADDSRVHIFGDPPIAAAIVDISPLLLEGKGTWDAKARAPLEDLTRLSLALDDLRTTEATFVGSVNATTLAALAMDTTRAHQLLTATLVDAGDELVAPHQARIDALLRERLAANMTAYVSHAADCTRAPLPNTTTTLHLCVRLADGAPAGRPLAEGETLLKPGDAVDPRLVVDWSDLPTGLAVMLDPVELQITGGITLRLLANQTVGEALALQNASRAVEAARVQLEKASRAGPDAMRAAMGPMNEATATLAADIATRTAGNATADKLVEDHRAHTAGLATTTLRPAIVRSQIVLWSTLVVGLGVALGASVLTVTRIDARYENLAAFKAMKGGNPARMLTWAVLGAGVACLAAGIVLAIVLRLDLLSYLVGTP